MQRVVDGVVELTKESVKTVVREVFNNVTNAVNGASAFALEFVPRRENIVNRLRGWELRPSFSAPRIPHWMEEGYSSLNTLIHDSYADVLEDSDYESDESLEEDDASAPSSPYASSTPRTSSSYHSADDISSPAPLLRPGRGLWTTLKRILRFLLRALLFLLRIPFRLRGGGSKARVSKLRQKSRPKTPVKSKPDSNGFAWRATGLGSANISRSSSSNSLSSMSRQLTVASKELTRRLNEVIEYVTHLNDNRRRGLVEDMELWLELTIERCFDFVRGTVREVVAPWRNVRLLLTAVRARWQRNQRMQQLANNSNRNRDSAEKRIGAGATHSEPIRLLSAQENREPLILQSEEHSLLSEEADLPISGEDSGSGRDGRTSAGLRRRLKPSGAAEGGQTAVRTEEVHSAASNERGALNSDARTCEDVINHAGYPFESVRLVTSDGYVLTLQRIPRKTSRKVVLLQHGILDSSLGWVSNGPIGSQAFAAYDQGFDVWLGNLRGYVNREHVNPRMSAAEYWNYSINEHGMLDIGAMADCIHARKLAELPPSASAPPYVLCGVAHSLGGAAMMIHVVTRRMRAQPHRFHRLILLSPAGFHQQCPLLFSALALLLPLAEPFLRPLLPGLFIPSRPLRLLFNKAAQDCMNLPALRALLQYGISAGLTGGDSSDWVGALRQPHYNVNDMPGLSLRVLRHFAQMKWAGRFQLFHHGSARANLRAYAHGAPLDVGAQYGLVDVPVDLVMGRRDRIVPAAMVERHFQLLRAAGREASLTEFEFAHLDFTFAQHQELLAYVMSRLHLAAASLSHAAL